MFKPTQTRGVLLVRLAGCQCTEEEEVLAVGQELAELLESSDCKELVVSLARAEGVGSALVGRLIALHKQAETTGRRLVLCGVEPNLHGMLEKAGLTRLFHIRD